MTDNNYARTVPTDAVIMGGIPDGSYLMTIGADDAAPSVVDGADIRRFAEQYRILAGSDSATIMMDNGQPTPDSTYFRPVFGTRRFIWTYPDAPRHEQPPTPDHDDGQWPSMTRYVYRVDPLGTRHGWTAVRDGYAQARKEVRAWKDGGWFASSHYGQDAADACNAWQARMDDNRLEVAR